MDGNLLTMGRGYLLVGFFYIERNNRGLFEWFPAGNVQRHLPTRKMACLSLTEMIEETPPLEEQQNLLNGYSQTVGYFPSQMLPEFYYYLNNNMFITFK